MTPPVTPALVSVPETDWIEWAGGPSPVESNRLIDVRMSDGVVSRAAPSGLYQSLGAWLDLGNNRRIVAYRLTEYFAHPVILSAPVAAAPAVEGGAVTPHQLSCSADCRTEFAAARLGVRTDELITAVEAFGLKINAALTTREEAPAEAGVASFWFDPRDPEVTAFNPDNILISYYVAFDVTMIQCGDLAMFGFWYDPADGSEFQYRYFSDRDQADAEALSLEAALRAQPQAPAGDGQ